MDRSDVEFTVSLNTSPAEQQLDKFLEKVKSRSGIVYSVKTDSNGLIPTIPRNAPTTNDYNETNLPAKILIRELERIFAVYRSQAQGMPGWRYAGSSVWNEQRKIGYDNLPQTADNRLQETINFIYKNNQQKWRYAGSSRADSVYEDFEDLHVYDNGDVPPKKPPFPSPSADGNDTPAEQGKDIVEQEKKDNDELKEKLLLWSKIGATIYAIRKVISGLAKLWKFGADTASGVNRNLNEEHGFFSIDPEGALRANTDKTRAIMYAGIRNMGSNAPVSKEGLDYASSKMTEMWTAAMSGRNVDARTTIDVQRLKDFFGIDLSVAGLLTGEREGKTATDIQIDMMDKVEKQISKLAEADEITKGQVIDSLRNILGDELVDAIVANANKNLKIDASDLKLTISEKLIQHGGSAIPSGNLTEATESAVKSISDLKDATDELKKTLLQELSPAFVSVTGVITKLTNWLTRFLNGRVLDEYETETGSVAISSMNEINDIQIPFNSKKLKKQLKENASIKYENNKQRVVELLKTKDPIDALNALFFSQPDLIDTSVLEKMGMAQQEATVAKALFGGKDEWENSDNPIIKRLKNYSYNGKRGQSAFLEMMKNQMSPLAPGYSAVEGNGTVEDKIMAFRWLADNVPEIEKAFSEEFGKNGKFDVTKSTMPVQYLYSAMMLGDAETQIKAIKQLAKESTKLLDNTVNITDVQHVDKNKNGRIDAGEVVFTVVVKDQYNNETRKTVTADLQ